jgi:hypothetical protein
MSCIRFSTPAQREAMRRMAPTMLSADEAAALASAPPRAVPPVTASKLARLRLLARDADPRIRESVASNPHVPADVVDELSRDADDGVRSWVARGAAASEDVLRRLAGDASERVRGFVALHPSTPPDAVELLAADPSGTVRGLVAWRTAAAVAG